MNKKYILFYVFCQLLFCQTTFSQIPNNLSTSPYSLYGLGLSNELNAGKTNALGRTGFAMGSVYSINNLNPASFGAILKGSFLYDIGLKLQQSKLYENGNEESRFLAGFSNFAMAFSISEKSGFGLTLIPYTNVGYVVLGMENQIDGSKGTFISNITGSGGLNDLKLNYGYSLNERLSVGLSGSILFGVIKENEINIIETTILNISEENFYNGFRVGAGLQFKLNNKFSFGGIVNFPVELNGDRTRQITINNIPEKETSDNLDAFKLPLEIGFGMHTQVNEKLFFNIDYKRSFWDVTNQSDLVGNYVDQDFIGFGAEFIPKKNSFKYWKKINYRTGFNFDNGSLAIKGARVNNVAFNLGLGLPIGKRDNSMLNVGYSYSQKGQVSNGLIKENFHMLTLNFSFNDFWFKKRLIN